MTEESIYEITPVNFVMLEENKRDDMMNRFRLFLNALNKPIEIIVRRAEREVMGARMAYHRFFIKSEEPIGFQLDSLGMSYYQVLELPPYEPIRARGKDIILQGGKLARTFTIYALPSQIVEGFLSETYEFIDKVSVHIEPIQHDKAVKTMGRYTRIMQGLVAAESSGGRNPDPQHVARAQTSNETFQLLFMGNTRLFKIWVNITVVAQTPKEMKEVVKNLKSRLEGRLIKIDAPSFIQPLLFKGVKGKTLYLDTFTASVLFPFVSAEVIEAGGIFIGQNKLTGAPLIYDPGLRSNYNIAAIGVSGSGKSFSGKLILTRLMQQNRKLPFFVVDPEAEYEKLGERLGAKIFKFDHNTNLGLDPLAIFSKLDASDIIQTVANVPPEMSGQLRSVVQRARSLEEVFQMASPELRNRLEGIVNGPESFVFKGEPLQFTQRMVFSLRGIDSDFLKQIVSILIFGKIWQTVNNPDLIPTQQQKVILIDEAWLYMQIPAAAKFLERVSRLGRKRNIIFITLTQRPADVLGETSDTPGPGRTVLENAATKVILRQDESTVKVVAQTFGLSQMEMEQVVEYSPGNALLISENVHIPIRFLATPDEYKLFTTKPSEVE